MNLRTLVKRSFVASCAYCLKSDMVAALRFRSGNLDTTSGMAHSGRDSDRLSAFLLNEATGGLEAGPRRPDLDIFALRLFTQFCDGASQEFAGLDLQRLRRPIAPICRHLIIRVPPAYPRAQ